MKFFYTYGTSEHYPFCGGWVEVEAADWNQAHEIYRSYYPDVLPNALNCAFCYTEAQFNATGMQLTGNSGAFCHRKLTAPKEKE